MYLSDTAVPPAIVEPGGSSWKRSDIIDYSLEKCIVVCVVCMSWPSKGAQHAVCFVEK